MTPSAMLVAMTLIAVPSGDEVKARAVMGAGVTAESTSAPLMVYRRSTEAMEPKGVTDAQSPRVSLIASRETSTPLHPMLRT